MAPVDKPSSAPLSHLGELSVEQFLAEYWQQKPLLIRQAFPQYTSPISAEELAGFALEEEVEARLISESPGATELRSEWQVVHGPLDESLFADLPESHWTLLVQAVDQWVPELADLLGRFRFLPNWRLDDLMVSYAADKGGVGPHYDHYDVFLLQAEGQRRWRVGQPCTSNTPRRTDTPMNILSEFSTAADYVLEPGDMLYLPPGVAHWGTAEGPCMTYSIGFRAPSYGDLLLDYATELAAELGPDQRFSDKGTNPATHSGEISKEAVETVRSILAELTQDDARIARWLASYGTQPKRNAPELEDSEEEATRDSRQVALKPRVRAAYVEAGPTDAVLYLDGAPSQCSLALARALSSYQPFEFSHFLGAHDQALLQQLLEAQKLLDR